MSLIIDQNDAYVNKLPPVGYPRRQAVGKAFSPPEGEKKFLAIVEKMSLIIDQDDAYVNKLPPVEYPPAAGCR